MIILLSRIVKTVKHFVIIICSKMDEFNINNLPAEILTEIFRFLNKENAKNATMVCKLWNGLIESAFRWLLKLKYGWNDSHLSMKKNFILTTNRKFGTIKIDEGSLNEDHEIVEIFKRHGFNVVELHLYNCRIDNLSGFAELLIFTPNLKHADVQIEMSHGSSDVLLVEQLLPDLKKLKSLVIYGGDYRVVKCFRNAKLTTMEIMGFIRSDHRSLLVDFLSTQDKLTSLNANLWSPSILVDIGKLNVPIPFRLKQLSISGITCQNPSQDHDHLTRFFESQAGNLTEIEMKYKISSCVYECVFVNMTKLTTIWTKTSHILRNNDFHHRLEENHNVHTVRLLDSGMIDIQFVGRFLHKLPNVRCLILTNTKRFSSNNILVMAQSLSKLELLYIDTIHGTPPDNVKFPNLKTLQIRHLRGRINWKEFTKAHSQLTELTIETMDQESYLTSEDIDQITTNVDLQCIRLGAGFVADNRFFEIVGSKCENLKVLDLHKSSISQNLGHYMKIDVLRLRESITCPKDFRARLFELK